MMMKHALVFGLMAVLSVAAEAQDTQLPEDIVCTTHRYFWIGSDDDIKDISSTPVPKSFRQRVEGYGCRNTARSDLIEWHRQYGSEDTLKEALSYLEMSVKTKGVSMVSRRRDSKPTFAQQAEDFTVIAQYYIMGAKAFPSLDFVKEAEHNLKKVRRLCGKLSPEERASWYSGCRLDGNATVTEKLTRDIAVTRALVSKEKSDVENAKSILEQVEMPHMNSFIENASQSFDSLCESGRVEPSTDIKAACKEKYNEEDVRIFLKQQALLATVEDRFSDELWPNKSYKIYYDLYPMLAVAEAHELADYAALPPRSFSEERAHLSLAFSDMHFHRAMKQAEKTSEDLENVDRYKSDEDIAKDIFISLDHLLAAEKYTPRYSDPSQWKRIAAKYVERMDLLSQLSPETRNGTWYSGGERNRQLEYFREGLDL